MKILVVDDDPVARKVLSSFLQQSKYEMVILEDGLSAFHALTAPDAPLVALIDWVMPDLSGTELCARLRAHPFAVQPYLIILSGRKEKTDIVQALDAGADDFISKPFNIQETQARLRVAVRSIERQQKLRSRLLELEAMIPLAQPLPTVSRNTETAQEYRREKERESSLPLPALDAHQMDAIVAGALRHSSIGATPRRAKAGPRAETPPVAWSSLLLVNEQIWVDLLLEADEKNLANFFEQSRQRRPSDRSEMVGFCTRLHKALHDSLHSVIRAMGADHVIAGPVHAVSYNGFGRPRPAAEYVQRHHYQVGSAALTVTVVPQPNPLIEKNCEQLKHFDLLVQPYPPPDTHCIPLLRAGVFMNEHLIEKLRSFNQGSATEVPPVLVHTPPEMALHHLWISGAATSRPAAPTGYLRSDHEVVRAISS